MENSVLNVTEKSMISVQKENMTIFNCEFHNYNQFKTVKIFGNKLWLILQVL
jgi:hypothetical protein